MAALMRCGLRKSHNLGQCFSGFILHEFKKTKGFTPLIKNARCLAALPKKKKRLLIDIHSRIDHNLGISKDLFNSLLSSLESHGHVTEHDIALLLHICSFGPFDSSSSDRLNYAENIWSRLEEMSVQPSSKLYNMKLKVYCSNGKNFTPHEELASMKSFGINPDKITYGFLIEGFCRNGDLSGANHVLEAMNDAQLYIGVSIFNSFITGHLKTGMPEEASKVLETMRSRGLTPNSDTYYRFVKHYAEEKDTGSVIKYIKDAEIEGVSLDQNTLMKVYRLMLLSGQTSHADRILPMLIEKDVFQNNAMQNLCQLVAEGFHNEALNLYLNIPKVVTENIPVSAGAFLLKSMVVNDQTTKDVVEVADKLLETNPNTTPHRFALLYAYKMGKHGIAMELLEEMMTHKQDVRIAQILPALCHFRDAGNVEGVYNTVDMIFRLETCEETMEVLETFCYPALRQLNQSNDDILRNMKDHQRKWNTFFMFTELQKDGCASALENAEEKALDDGLVSWLDNNQYVLFRHLPEQTEPCVKLLSKLIKKNSLNKFVGVCVVLNRLTEDDLDSANSMLDLFKEEKIRFPNHYLRLRKITEAPQEIQDKMKALCEFQPLFSMKELQEKTKEELQDYIKKNPTQTIARIVAMNKAMIDKDLSEVHKRLREIKAVKFIFPTFQLINIITSLIDLGDVETASLYFKELQENYEYIYDDTTPLAIAVKHVEEGNIQGALEMVDAAKKGKMRSPGIRRSKVSNLLKATKTMDEAQSIHEALLKGGSYLIEEDASIAHHHYIKKALDMDDDKDLLVRLRRLCDQYWVFPCMDMVISRFIQKQDVESLKEVIDLSISVVGNDLFHHKLACNFIACGMPSKAAAIFQKLDGKLNSRVLETSCKYFTKNKQVDHVESLVEMVKTLSVSRVVMLKQLIKAYVSVNAMDKATEVLYTFDNEFLVPHKSILDYLATSLKKCNMEQPDILKAFLSKRETLDEVQPHDSESSSSLSSESESNTEAPQEKSESLQQSSSESTETKTP